MSEKSFVPINDFANEKSVDPRTVNNWVNEGKYRAIDINRKRLIYNNNGKNKKTTTIALIQAKGGVAKTTSAVHIAIMLAKSGLKVLLQDYDHQNQCKFFFNQERLFTSNNKTSLNVFHSNSNIKECIRQTDIPSLDIVISDMELSFRENEIAGNYYIAKDKILEIENDYDFIIIDNNPSMNSYVKNSIFASDYVLLPVVPSPLAAEGFQTLLKEVNALFEQNQLKTKILGIFYTIVEENLTVTQYFKNELNKEYHDLIFDTQIRKDVRLIEAPGLRTNVFDYKEKCRGSQDYKSIVYELLRKL